MGVNRVRIKVNSPPLSKEHFIYDPSLERDFWKCRKCEGRPVVAIGLDRVFLFPNHAETCSHNDGRQENYEYHFGDYDLKLAKEGHNRSLLKELAERYFSEI